MVFSSAVFLFIFLPVVLFVHTVIRSTAVRNGFLIAASLVFYAFGEPVYVLLMVGSVAVNFMFGRVLAFHKKKPVLAVAVILNIGLLVVYKYAAWLVEMINLIPAVDIPVPQITMPIGISFFTFQAISYVIDTYRSEENEKSSFWDVLLYISLFPQLIAGPIVKYNSIKDQIHSRTVNADKLASGIRLFIIGLSKKMLISNTMGAAADKVFAMEIGIIDTPLAWLGAVCYTLQIYFDFSGYSNMAMGLGRAMGFDFPENFNYPYSARGIRDFWRRWHMSLTGWFREYLYIPLGGNRKGKARQLLNTMIVFMATGIWHGANLTFILWGFMYGVLMCIETLFVKRGGSHVSDGSGALRGTDSGRHVNFAPVKWLYTIFFVIIGFVIFRADSVGYAFSYIGKMFSFVTADAAQTAALSLMTPVFLVTLAAALIAMFPVVPCIGRRLEGKRAAKAVNAVCYVLMFGLYFLCVLTLAADSYNPFIYFRF